MALICQSLTLRAPVLLLPRTQNPGIHSINYMPKNPICLRNKPYLTYSPRSSRITPLAAAAASASPKLPSQSPKAPTVSPLNESTRTITTLVTLAVTLFAKLAQKLSLSILNPNPQELDAIRLSLQGSLAHTVGPAFFASLRDRPSGYLNTPLTVVAAGLSKWLDIYSGVLMVRVLLSWFPNIPWDRQPLSAIRDLCDPYLNLFRNIIPPIFDTLDVSPLLAFAVLGTLGSILNNSRGMY